MFGFFLGVRFLVSVCRMAFALEVQKATLRERALVLNVLLVVKRNNGIYMDIYIYMKVYYVHWVIWWHMYFYNHSHILLPPFTDDFSSLLSSCEWRMVYITRVPPWLHQEIPWPLAIAVAAQQATERPRCPAKPTTVSGSLGIWSDYRISRSWH